MKKAIFIDVICIILGLCFLILASFNTFGNEILKTILAAIGSFLIVAQTFDIVHKIKDKKKNRTRTLRK